MSAPWFKMPEDALYAGLRLRTWKVLGQMSHHTNRRRQTWITQESIANNLGMDGGDGRARAIVRDEQRVLEDLDFIRPDGRHVFPNGKWAKCWLVAPYPADGNESAPSTMATIDDADGNESMKPMATIDDADGNESLPQTESLRTEGNRVKEQRELRRSAPVARDEAFTLSSSRSLEIALAAWSKTHKPLWFAVGRLSSDDLAEFVGRAGMDLHDIEQGLDEYRRQKREHEEAEGR